MKAKIMRVTLALVVCLLIFWGYRHMVPTHVESRGSYIFLPNTLEELENSSEIIVIGRVDKIIEHHMEVDDDKKLPLSWRTLTSFKIEEVIKGGALEGKEIVVWENYGYHRDATGLYLYGETPMDKKMSMFCF